jgi:hypothetical protein
MHQSRVRDASQMCGRKRLCVGYSGVPSSGSSLRISAAYVCVPRVLVALRSTHRQQRAQPEQGCDKPEPK